MDSRSSKSSAFHLVSARLAAESARADAAEHQVADLLAQIRVFHQDRLNLRAELSKSQQELQLWKIQLELAQKEILRAQQVVGQVDQARVDAEERAHRSRQKVRRLLEERAIQVALDEGRNLGFQEGLELGRRGQPQHFKPNFRPPTRRRSSAIQRNPEQSVPTPTSAPLADPQPTASALLPASHPDHPEAALQTQNDANSTSAPIPNTTDAFPNTSNIPPDNYIPTIHGNGSRIVLPPPHEWKPRLSGSQGAPPRSDSQSTRRASESGTSVKSTRPRSDSRSTAPSPPPVPPPPPPAHGHSYPQPTSPRFTAPSVPSPQSSHLSQFDLVSEPRGNLLDSRPNMTQPERIADEWRSHNLEILTNQSESSSSGVIPRPMSTGSVLPVPPNPPPQRPTTTDSFRSGTPRAVTVQRKPREVILPVPISNFFYDANANPNPSSNWLKSRFQNERTTSNTTIPNIDVEPPSHSPTNSERTIVDPVLLTPENANRPAPLQGTDDPSPAVAASPIFDIYARAEKHQRHQSHDTTTTTPDDEHITGILPSDKDFPPGFVPLSPIPTLSNLTSIPEPPPEFDTNINSHSKSQIPKSAPRLTVKPSSPGRIYTSVPVPGPLNSGLPYPGFYPVSADITVMRTDVSPAMRARVSPAPLNRPFSIFSDV